MPESYVTLKELAEEFGRDRSALRKWIQKHPSLKHEVKILRVRPIGNASGMPSHAFSLADADRIRQARDEEGFGVSIGSHLNNPMTSAGWFYIVQPVPEFDEHRVKLGFAIDIKQRLDTYRTICPHVIVLKAWPCRPTWEHTAMTSITREGCTVLGQELFQCDDLASLVDRADAFFKLMPAW